MNRYLALCFSRKEDSYEASRWAIPGIPFFCLTGGENFVRNRSRDRVEYLAKMWNLCYKTGLEKYPETTHVIHTTTYYLDQSVATYRLLRFYDWLGAEMILSGNVWLRTKFPILHYKTYDTWACPELDGIRHFLHRPPGRSELLQMTTVGPPFIHPVATWRQHPFHNPEDLDKDGIWYNQFCRESGLPVFADLGIRFYRTGYSYPKGLRVWLGALRRQWFWT